METCYLGLPIHQRRKLIRRTSLVLGRFLLRLTAIQSIPIGTAVESGGTDGEGVSGAHGGQTGPRVGVELLSVGADG